MELTPKEKAKRLVEKIFPPRKGSSPGEKDVLVADPPWVTELSTTVWRGKER